MKVLVAPPKGKLEKVQYEAWLTTNGIQFKWLTKRDTKIDRPLILCVGADIGKDVDRDALEFYWIEMALEAKQPIIGVCRGMQILNYYFGGLVKDLDGKLVESHSADDFSEAEDHVGKRSQYHNVFDQDGNQMQVNSRHHQYCAVIASNFIATHWTKGRQVIEGFADPEQQIWAVQWHPERAESDDNSYPLDKLFAK